MSRSRIDRFRRVLSAVNPLCSRRLILAAGLAIAMGAEPVWSQAKPKSGDSVMQRWRARGQIMVADSPARDQLMVVEAKAVWRFGEETDPVDGVFGRVVDACVEPDGTTYLVDSQLCRVLVFDAAGELEATIGRCGEGPGEFTIPQSVAVVGGGRIAVARYSLPPDVTVVDRNGVVYDFSLPERAGFGSSIDGLTWSGEVLWLLQRYISPPDDARMWECREIVGVEADGTFRFRAYERRLEFENAGQSYAEWKNEVVWAVNRVGDVFLNDRYDEWLIDVVDADGTRLTRLQRDFEIPAWSDRERRELEEGYRLFERRMGCSIEIPPHPRAIDKIFVREDGTLWVETAMTQVTPAPGVMGPLDAIDPDGRFTTALEIRFDGRVSQRHTWIRGQWVVTVVGGGEAPDSDEMDLIATPEIICYRLADGSASDRLDRQ